MCTRHSSSVLPATDDERCRYTYSRCPNPRIYRRSGVLHTLCEYHRSKANAIQKAYAAKRRQSQRAQRKQHILAQRQREVASGLPEPIPFSGPRSATTTDTTDMAIVALLLSDIQLDMEPVDVQQPPTQWSEDECSFLDELFSP
ncbi:hypothetical protein SPRG_15010 [Saprolegnia parasitica CBS 223.65]|uniref:Uncharacterized protein n=1 Tax=Saprolegnia parasitica (strain CBS 223.65) TaxID=695850 RepID=A0A067BXL2_SAPPC|nr:hypothetical protein SPRG_15010 [Saprolegnia parasitica CBS 223.65]KDO19056.1 hypothetical protein SPRG_15010 [Saprolegnia parasitica CBS 223.65]|eukprot:XP_012210244.1 hypothetical protein SPRG_15010 [Saprolegnia parasitica CBS 223.65]